MTSRTYPEYSTHYPLLLTECMKRPLKMYPDDSAIVYRNEEGEYLRLTWLQWYQRTCQLANALINLGVKKGDVPQPGDRIATMALNHHRHLELIYAVSCIGAVAHSINTRLSLDQITYTINHAQDKILFFDDEFLPILESIYDKIKSTIKIFVYMSDRTDKPKTRIAPLYYYEELINGQAADCIWPELDENSYASMYYTTGTTGLPKAAMFTHRQLYLQMLHVQLDYYASPRFKNQIPEPASRISMFNIPLFHIHAWGSPYYEIFLASKIILPGKFTPQTFCELAEKEQVTYSDLVPTMLAMLIEYKDIKKYDLSSLQKMRIGGGALSSGLKTKAMALLPNCTTISGYGMTETAGRTLVGHIKRNMINWPKPEIDKIMVKTGIPYPGIEVRVIDPESNPVPRDNETIGEITVRGHWVMGQYYKDQEKTAAAWKDGWFHTGDAAKIDKDGYITIVDRITDVIRSGAEMVPTVLLENLTCSADFVLEATYVGVPDELWGERPMAIIKPAPGSNPTAQDLLTFLQKECVDAGKITRWMLPEYVVFTDNIPKTSVGKFDKVAIRKSLDIFLSKAVKVQ
jgi:fatty-acyl-CoA synthase